MKRRKFLVGVGATAAGGSALLGTGAFSRVESHRSVTIEVAEDPDAYLGLDKCDTPNGSYAHLDDHGHLRIFMDDENPTIGTSPLGQGVNSDSRTWFDNVFQVCNQGKEDVCLYIEDHENWPMYGEEERRVEFYLGSARESSLIGQENQTLLPLGECVCVGIRTTTKGLSEGDELLEMLDNSITIVADVDGDCFLVEEAPCGVPANNVVDSEQGYAGPGPGSSPRAVRSDPDSALGGPDAGSYPTGTYDESKFFSLGFGDEENDPGFLELSFPGQIVRSNTGPDLVIYEATNGDRLDYGLELVDVYVTRDGNEWKLSQQASSRSETLGDNDGVSELNIDGSIPGTQFDSVKLVDQTDPDDFGSQDWQDGFDLDAVEACLAPTRIGGDVR